MTIKDIRPPEDIPALLENVSMTSAGLDDAEVWRHRKKDGNIIYVKIVSHTLDFNGRRAGLVLATITESVQAEDRIRLQSQIFEIMAEGVNLIRASDGIIVYANPRFEQMFGYEPGGMIGIHVSVINAPTEKNPQDVAEEISKVLTEKGEWRGEIYNVRKDSTKFWCSVNIKAFQHPEHGNVWISVHTDINERKRAEERLSKLNECFLSFGTDPLENINRLTALCGELMGATAALYNRLDKGMLCSWGQWNTPPDYNPLDKPQGHICYDTINRGSDEVLVVRNLAETRYARTDPNVMAYNLKTYIGRAVRLGNDYVGSLCVVYQNDFSPGEHDKRFMGVIASAIAVEERRRQSEKSFMESELRFRSIVQSANDAIILADSNGRLILWNKGAQAIFGYTEEEMIGKPASFMIPERYRKKVEFVMSTGKSDFFGKTIESAGYRKDGREFPLEISMAIWNIEKEAYYSVIIRDITERKLTEKALKESEQKYRTLMNDAGDAIILADKNGNVLEVNKKAEELLGYTKEELSNMNIAQIHPKEELERTIAAFKVSATLNDVRVLRKDGKTVPVDISGSTIEYAGKKVIQGIFRDITERKHAEEELRSKEYLLSEAQRIAHIGSWDTNIVTGKMTWSDEMYRIYGVSPDTFELTRESFKKLIHPDDQAAMLRWVFAAISGKKEPELDFRIILPDGTVRFIRSSGEVIFDDKGKPIRMTGTGQDITERKRNEEALKESEERYRKLVELSPIAIAVHSHGKVVFANTAAAKLLGAAGPGQLVGKKISEIVHPESRKLVDERIRKMLEKGEVVPPAEEKFIRLDGSVLDVEVAAMPFPYKGKQGMQVIAHDITVRKRAEEMLKERARAELYGFIVSALPVFASNVPSSVRDNLVRNFAERFEKNVRPRFGEEIKRLGDTQTQETIDIFMLWLGNFFSNMGVRNRTAIEGPKGQLMLLNCPWKGDASSNPVFCFICRTIAIRSFTWSSLKGSAGQKSSIANGAKACIFEIYLSSGMGEIK
ncbi:Methyl sulfide methyltransferase-associated sensor [uncultured archaeon]|nr:Methyl sulfide methyltransferase-associated sensor [uncultured archaeon]